MIRLSKEQVILLHQRLIEATGGSNGIRDDGMLDSALANPFQSFGDEELYPSIQAKAAQICFGIVKNHPMVDGNKRLGIWQNRCGGYIAMDYKSSKIMHKIICNYKMNNIYRVKLLEPSKDGFNNLT